MFMCAAAEISAFSEGGTMNRGKPMLRKQMPGLYVDAELNT